MYIIVTSESHRSIWSRFLFAALLSLLCLFEAFAQESPPKVTPETGGSNNSGAVEKKDPVPLLYEVIRVSEPNIFHVKAAGLEVRLKAWGIGCPRRNQPQYREALRFAEEELLGLKVKLEVKREFDPDGYKQVLLYPEEGKTSFNRSMIARGFAWHLDKDTKRFGPFSLAQIKAKRERSGIWGESYAYDFDGSAYAAPKPTLPSLLQNQGVRGQAVRIQYWQSFVGKVHRPGCAFYAKGSGTLTPNPQGRDCGVCGGRQGPRR